MRLDKLPVPDWRDPAVYEDLLAADRVCFAWEWLRRDPDYRTAAIRGAARRTAAPDLAAPERWGLHAFENPGLPAMLARPMWIASRYPGVLGADALPAPTAADAFDLRPLSGYLALHRGADGREHLLFGDGRRLIRLDICSGSILRGRKTLRFRIDGLSRAGAPLLTLRRLIALARTGSFSPQLHRREARASYWVLALRAADAIAEGACQREIAGVLLGLDSARLRWRQEEPNVRARAQRLVQQARRFANGGYAAFLA